MNWFFYALLAAFVYSCSIVIDKALLTRQFRSISELSLTTAAALAGIPLLAILLLFVRPLPSLHTLKFGLAAGWLLILAYQLYYIALRKADAALITTLFQLVLPFNFIIGIVFFNEKPTLLQVAGLIIITLGATLISLEQKERKWRLRTDVLLLMASASLLLSTSDAVFKNAAENIPFFTLAVSEYASSVIAGFLLFLLVPKVRRELSSLRNKLTNTLGVLEFNELLTVCGTIAIRYSLVIGPIALIQGVMGTQPLMVMLIIGMLGLFGIHMETRSKKRGSLRHTMVKLVAIIFVCTGSVFISGAASKL